MSWYNIEKKEELSKKEYLAKVKYDKIISKKVKEFIEIVDVDLKSGVQYRFVTEKSFNAIVVIDFLIKNFEIDEVFISVFRMNLNSVRKIKELFDSGIKCNVIVSSFFQANKKYERWANELYEFGKYRENVNICFSLNHAKVFLCKTKCGKYIVFEGSGNLSDNSITEQYLIENNKEIFEFHKEWIVDAIKNRDGDK